MDSVIPDDDFTMAMVRLHETVTQIASYPPMKRTKSEQPAVWTKILWDDIELLRSQLDRVHLDWRTECKNPENRRRTYVGYPDRNDNGQ